MSDYYPGLIDIQDRIVGLIPHVIARPTVYCGIYTTRYLKRWADYMDQNVLRSSGGTKDVRIYAQYGDHSGSFTMFAIPSCKPEPFLMPAVSGLMENYNSERLPKIWFKENE
jgi:hypothetical protein